jgi:L-asparaginase II
LQALPLLITGAADRFGFTDREVALACGSHNGEHIHTELAASMLRKIGLGREALKCGAHEPYGAEAALELREKGEQPNELHNNCSGKHAAMIAVCRAHGWPVEGYRHPDHPLQQALHAEVAAAAELEPKDVPTGPDGCGVVCFALPLERAARAFSRFEQLDGGTRIAAAMRARPELVGGNGGTDTELMRTVSGWIAKGGAEGLMCAASADGLGIALKTQDGNSRALRPALAQFGAALGVDLSGFAEQTIRNSHGEPAGSTARF